MRFIDTNVFVRHLTQDDPAKGAAATALFRRVQAGQEEITTCEAVITEIVYVLSSRATYHLTPMEIRARLVPVLIPPNVRLQHKEVYLRALDLYVLYPALDFEDVILIAHMERAGIRELFSYDRDFDRVQALIRHEP